ncbi:hypothetical protein M422DRAFT_264298 [Sphaerobolus stellatus SS14]|uniref:Uncharacterized protein n=1 Tax=Sphaerobolus stellatus (strain SS14) TaxID=990650 RepID=A0A0C9V8A6_SPHS4|nr:hypothetical protein M422DRAFT_264298 [Sphaerobolus stellatus SS14]
MKTTEGSTKETENFTNLRPYCTEDLNDLKATDLRNLVKDNPSGKCPEEQHRKFYQPRLPAISVMSVLCDPSSGYTRGAFSVKRPYRDFWLRTNDRALLKKRDVRAF